MHSPLITRVFTLAGIGLVVGAVHSAIRPVTLTPAAPAPKPVAPAPGTAPPAGAQPSAPAALGLDISIEQAHSLFQKGVKFLDARHPEEYAAGHVENAFLLPAEAFLGGKTPDVLGILDHAETLVVYCGGGACDASKNLVILLQQAGFANCHIMTDGFPGWQKAGLPTATGKDPFDTGGDQ